MTPSAKPIMFTHELKLVHFIVPAFSYAQFANINWSAFPEYFLLTM